MSAFLAGKGSMSGEALDNYRYFSLIELIVRIVNEDDEQALREFHDSRSVFCDHSTRRLRFAEYVESLRQSILPRKHAEWKALAWADFAYDLTCAKFSNLPCDPKGPSIQQGHVLRRDGPDCRLYFRSFLNHVARVMNPESPLTLIEQDMRAADTLQSLVSWHFFLSWEEARRRVDRYSTRYIWEVNGGSITVYFPAGMGRGKRPWLEENVDNPDPRRPGEQKRVQSIIDEKLIKPKSVEFREALKGTACEAPEEVSDTWLSQISVQGLAKVVAAEKAERIDKLRASIRALGKEGLTQMILRIFQDLSQGKYEDFEVARSFGLTKSSFSRFAGSKWATRQGRNIPDLWLNTARMIGAHPSFSSAAKEARVWERVQAIINVGVAGGTR